MEKEVTIYDIARQVRLSPATVSRALNDHPAISRETKAMVTALAQQMGYRSNPFATNLRRQRTNTLGVIVPRLNSIFLSTVLAGMEKVANAASYNLVISQSLESVRKEVANARTLFDSRVDGLLVSLAFDTDTTDHFEAFLKKGIPLLYFDRVPVDQGMAATAGSRLSAHPATQVVIDNEQASYEAVRHLIEQGCRRVLHLTGNLRCSVYADRLAGYRRALAEYDLAFEESLVLETDLGIEAGHQAARQLQAMADRPDGVFVTNDFSAVSCLAELKRLGLRVPTDVAMVGFNDDPITQVVEPALTTVHYPGELMGETAARALIDTLNGAPSPGQVVIPSRLVVRGSSLRRV